MLRWEFENLEEKLKRGGMSKLEVGRVEHEIEVFKGVLGRMEREE